MNTANNINSGKFGGMSSEAAQKEQRRLIMRGNAKQGGARKLPD